MPSSPATTRFQSAAGGGAGQPGPLSNRAPMAAGWRNRAWVRQIACGCQRAASCSRLAPMAASARPPRNPHRPLLLVRRIVSQQASTGQRPPLPGQGHGFAAAGDPMPPPGAGQQPNHYAEPVGHGNRPFQLRRRALRIEPGAQQKYRDPGRGQLGGVRGIAGHRRRIQVRPTRHGRASRSPVRKWRSSCTASGVVFMVSRVAG